MSGPVHVGRGVGITLKLYADLADYLPAELDGKRRTSNELPVTVAAGTTVAQVLERFRVPAAKSHLVLVNGVFVPREARDARALQTGDALAVWPPIAGG